MSLTNTTCISAASLSFQEVELLHGIPLLTPTNQIYATTVLVDILDI